MKCLSTQAYGVIVSLFALAACSSASRVPTSVDFAKHELASYPKTLPKQPMLHRSYWLERLNGVLECKDGDEGPKVIFDPDQFDNRGDVELGEVIQTISRLSIEERTGLLQRAKAVSRSQKKTSLDSSELIRLALYDLPVWHSYLERLIQEGSSPEELKAVYLQLVRQMPEQLRSEVLEKIARIYPDLRTKKESDAKRLLKRIGWLQPKRAIDLALDFLLTEGEPIRDPTRVEHDPEGAFKRYFEANHGLVGISGQYEFAQVMAVVRKAQEVLQTIAPGGQIVLFGSFIAGRADLNNTDLDILAKGVGPQSLRARLHERVEGILKRRLKISIEDQGLTERAIGNYGPVLVRITAKNVELVVYPFRARKSRQGFEPAVVQKL